jgi:threonine aldolase
VAAQPPILDAMPLIDLRSDTVTKPSPEMRRAMAEAEVGDDVFGEDPTVNALEERAAELLGKEAGLFVSSGTQGNLVAQLAHLQRGMETIAGAQTHIIVDEAGGHAVIVRTTVSPIPEQPDGTLDLGAVDGTFRADDVHQPISGLVAIENTHAMSMAQPLTPAYTAAIGRIAHGHGVPLHVDGARFFNAVVAQGVKPTDLSGPADSVTFCLSKGLACPAGSMVVGSRDFIFRARRARKMVGGGMRQVGVMAAPGLIALRDGPSGMIERLAEDHVNARLLAEALAAMPGIGSPGDLAQPTPGRLDPGRVRTNFVLFKVDRDREAFLEALADRNILMVGYPHGQIRAATHYGVTTADIEIVIRAVAGVLRETAVRPAPGDDTEIDGSRASNAQPTAAVEADGRRTERPRVVIAH